MLVEVCSAEIELNLFSLMHVIWKWASINNCLVCIDVWELVIQCRNLAIHYKHWQYSTGNTLVIQYGHQ